MREILPSLIDQDEEEITLLRPLAPLINCENRSEDQTESLCDRETPTLPYMKPQKNTRTIALTISSAIGFILGGSFALWQNNLLTLKNPPEAARLDNVFLSRLSIPSNPSTSEKNSPSGYSSFPCRRNQNFPDNENKPSQK